MSWLSKLFGGGGSDSSVGTGTGAPGGIPARRAFTHSASPAAGGQRIPARGDDRKDAGGALKRHDFVRADCFVEIGRLRAKTPSKGRQINGRAGRAGFDQTWPAKGTRSPHCGPARCDGRSAQERCKENKKWLKKPAARAEFVLFDIVHDDGSQRSNRKVPGRAFGAGRSRRAGARGHRGARPPDRREIGHAPAQDQNHKVMWWQIALAGGAGSGDFGQRGGARGVFEHDREIAESQMPEDDKRFHDPVAGGAILIGRGIALKEVINSTPPSEGKRAGVNVVSPPGQTKTQR